MDLRVEFPLGDSQGYVDVFNATGETYPDVSGLPIPGRGFMAGIRTPFGR